FLPLPNFCLGYNESKIIEVAEVIRSIVANRPMLPTFDTGHHICQIVDSCMESSRQRKESPEGRVLRTHVDLPEAEPPRPVVVGIEAQPV
ncbi:hypothetical protein ACC739_36925, partial [Rhizobium ruizarguesonis]